MIKRINDYVSEFNVMKKNKTSNVNLINSQVMKKILDSNATNYIFASKDIFIDYKSMVLKCETKIDEKFVAEDIESVKMTLFDKINHRDIFLLNVLYLSLI